MSDADTSFDTPEDEDVLQYDEDLVTPPEVPVVVQNTIRTDEMPTETAYRTIVLHNESPPFKLLNGDPRRKKVVMWITSIGADSGIFFGKQEQVQPALGDGAFLQISTVPLRIENGDKDEVWVRPADVTDSAGHWTGWAIPGSDVIISMLIENWAR